MIGRRAAIGLSLLSAFLFCAFAASSASASVAQNTTSFTCVEGGGNEDFSDVHCDNKVAAGTGEFGHVEIEVGKTTVLEGHNGGGGGGGTNAVLKGKVLGVAAEVTCTTLFAEGSQTNEEPSAGAHNTLGSANARFTGCSVQKPLKCDVKEPIETSLAYQGVEGLGPGKNEMGLEYKPAVGTTFAAITFINNGGEKCSIAEQTINVQGTAIGTGAPAPTEKHAGARILLTNAMTKETLTFGGTAAEFSVNATVQAAGKGTPIALTTTT